MTDPLPDVLLGVVANGVTAALANIAGRARDVARARTTVGRALSKDVDWSSALALVVQGVPGHDLNRLATSSDFAAFVWQGACLWMPGGQWSTIDQEGLHARLRALVVLYGQPTPDDAERTTNLLMSLLEHALRGVTKERTTKRSPLSRLLVPSDVAAEQSADGVRLAIEALRRDWSIDLDAILRFEQNLRIAVELRHGWIETHHVGDARKIPIDELYVTPDLWPSRSEEDREERTLGYSDFVANIGRTVLLGNPGGGKSTLSFKVAHDVAARRVLSGILERLIPIVVTVREYGAARADRQEGIREFLETVCRVQYQIDPPEAAIDYLLMSGRCLLILDGLDELLVTSLRRAVSTDVELFASRFPATPILVTSREVGYREAPLDESPVRDLEARALFGRKGRRVRAQVVRDRPRPHARGAEAPSRLVRS